MNQRTDRSNSNQSSNIATVRSIKLRSTSKQLMRTEGDFVKTEGDFMKTEGDLMKTQTDRDQPILVNGRGTDNMINLIPRTSKMSTPVNYQYDRLKQRLSQIFVNTSPQEHLLKYQMSLSKIPDSGDLSNIKEVPYFQIPKRKQKALEQQQQKKEQMNNFINLLENKKGTILNYGFRSGEKQSNMYIRPLMRLVNNSKNSQQSCGTMFVADLWSDKNIKMVLAKQNIIKDSFLINRIGKKEGMQPKQNFTNSLFHNKKDDKLIKQIYDFGNVAVRKRRTYLDYLSTKSSKLLIQKTPNETSQQLQNLLTEMDEFHNSNLTLYTEVTESIRRLNR